MALKSGFFNAFLTEGNYDRKYNADDYSDNMGAIIRNGVLRDGNNGFRVTRNGLVLSVSPGRAWIEGRWAHLDSVHTFPAVVPPVGDYSRIDRIVLRLNNNTGGRSITLEYVVGTARSSPSAPALVREDNIYEIGLATIRVNPNATSVSVTDTRANKSVCGWVTTPVGYDDYFEALDAEFEDWFKEKRDALSSVTMFKQYMWRTTLESSAKSVSFDIPQYDSTGVDIIQVYVNGLLETEGAEYTLNGRVITFSGTKVSGTEIVVICYKSIDGTGLRSVSDEITTLQNQVATLGDISDYNYICTGNADNVALSEIAQTFLSGADDGRTMTVRIYGTMGATSAYGGSGTTADPYRWFAFGRDVHTSRRICFDFENCSQVNITCASATHNIVFYGHNVYVKNAKLRVTCDTSNSSCIGFNSTSGTVLCERVVMQIYGYSGCYFASNGTFTDCSVAVHNNNGVGRCFVPTTDSFLRVFGGDYYAYADTGRGSAVFYVASGLSNAVVIANAVSCPTINKSGYVQDYAVYDLSANGKCAYNNTVSSLTVSATSQSVTGTIAANKRVGAW